MTKETRKEIKIRKELIKRLVRNYRHEPVAQKMIRRYQDQIKELRHV